MSRKIRQRGPLSILLMLVIGFLWMPAHAQEQKPPSQLVHVCVDPVDTEVPIEPYLITFRNTDLFGLVVSENATVTVYGGSETPVAVGVYAIAPDAQTGGYRRIAKVAVAYTRSDLPAERACNANPTYSGIIPPELSATIPVPVSADYAVLVQIGGDDHLDGQDFLGAFSFHFRPEAGDFQKDFQLIQLSETAIGIELGFPFLSQNSSTRFALFGNKEIAVRRSFAENPDKFSAPIPSNERSLFMSELENVKLDLFQMMDEGKARIYPYHGVLWDYPAGGFLKLEIAPKPAAREPAFTKDDKITPLEGTSADYIISETERRGTLNPTDQARVDEVRSDTGELIITGSKLGTSKGAVEAWLVEIVPRGAQ